MVVTTKILSVKSVIILVFIGLSQAIASDYDCTERNWISFFPKKNQSVFNTDTGRNIECCYRLFEPVGSPEYSAKPSVEQGYNKSYEVIQGMEDKFRDPDADINLMIHHFEQQASETRGFPTALDTIKGGEQLQVRYDDFLMHPVQYDSAPVTVAFQRAEGIPAPVSALVNLIPHTAVVLLLGVGFIGYSVIRHP